MIWDARKIDDRAYHRRRVLIGGIGVALSLFLLTNDFASGGFASRWKDYFLVGAHIVALGFFSRMMVRELSAVNRDG